MKSESSAMHDLKPFSVRHVLDVEKNTGTAAWLIEPLWLNKGVGIIGGVPKALKTWVSAELALAVAAPVKAFGAFVASISGPVLFFGAEDEASALRARFESIAMARGVHLEDIPLFLLEVPRLCLEQENDQRRLRQSIKDLKPKLLILDPFVRLSNVDENSAQEVSKLLGVLRGIQREFELAIIITHHMRKSPSQNLGQQLRGSGDFAAWADSLLYLSRKKDHVVLTGEHRSAQSPPLLRFYLNTQGPPHLTLVDQDTCYAADTNPIHGAIIERLAVADRPLTTVELRSAIRVRKSTLVEELRVLQEKRLIVRDAKGYILTSSSPAHPSDRADLTQSPQATTTMELPQTEKRGTEP